jgi:thioredoxin-related protein
VFEAAYPSSYPAGHELRKLTSIPYTPVFVFLDAAGRKVLETRGFYNEREAKALHEYVTKRHYARTGLQEFLAGYPK